MKLTVNVARNTCLILFMCFYSYFVHFSTVLKLCFFVISLVGFSEKPIIKFLFFLSLFIVYSCNVKGLQCCRGVRRGVVPPRPAGILHQSAEGRQREGRGGEGQGCLGQECHFFKNREVNLPAIAAE